MTFLEGQGGRIPQSEENKPRQREDPGYKKQFNPNKCVSNRVWKLNASIMEGLLKKKKHNGKSQGNRKTGEEDN